MLKYGLRARVPMLGLVLGLAVTVSPFSVFAAAPCPYVWSTNLKVGSKGADVLALQQFLNSDPATTIASSGPGSPGSETEKFGGMTKKAVVAFQEKYADEILIPNGLIKGNGNVGAATRAKLNALCIAPKTTSTTTGSVMGAATTTEVDMLTVSIPQQPAQSIMPANALYVPFTNFALTAGANDVTVRSVTIQRTGPASDRVFSDVEIVTVDGEDIGSATFNSNHQAVIKDEFTVPAYTTMQLTVLGNATDDMSDHNGEMPALQVAAIDASAPISGSMPVIGTGHVANSTLTIGTAHSSLSGYDPNTERTRYINDTGITFSAIRISAGSAEAVRLDSITWEQNGTASSADLGNVATVINGVSYAAELEDGRAYTSVFPGGIIIPKGETIDVAVRGDLLITGSNRTVQFDLHYGTDAVLYGLTYGFGIALTPESNIASSGNSVFLTDTGDSDGTSLAPFFAGSKVNILSSSATHIGR